MDDSNIIFWGFLYLDDPACSYPLAFITGHAVQSGHSKDLSLFLADLIRKASWITLIIRPNNYSQSYNTLYTSFMSQGAESIKLFLKNKSQNHISKLACYESCCYFFGNIIHSKKYFTVFSFSNYFISLNHRLLSPHTDGTWESFIWNANIRVKF